MIEAQENPTPMTHGDEAAPTGSDKHNPFSMNDTLEPHVTTNDCTISQLRWHH